MNSLEYLPCVQLSYLELSALNYLVLFALTHWMNGSEYLPCVQLSYLELAAEASWSSWLRNVYSVVFLICSELSYLKLAASWSSWLRNAYSAAFQHQPPSSGSSPAKCHLGHNEGRKVQLNTMNDDDE